MFVLLSVTAFLGRFHPLLVHLPIGFLLIALLLQWLHTRPAYNISAEVIKVVFLAGMLAALLSCITGYLLSLSGDYDRTLVSWHMWMGIAVAMVSMLLYVRLVNGRMDRTYKSLCAGLFVLIMVTGHLGGTLTHGSDYLAAGWRETSGDTAAYIKFTPIKDVQQAFVYADIVKPMLSNDCYGCHGRNKQKGGFRMDDSLLLMKGGKNGKEIWAGNAAKSELIKRLLLPREDEHHMPPKEKPQLNEKQIALLHWWVETGASMQLKVKDLPQAAPVKQALLVLQAPLPVNRSASDVPAAPVDKAPDAALTALKNKDIIVMPVAQNSNYLFVDFTHASKLQPGDWDLLLPVKKQLIALNAAGAAISSQAVNAIKQCTSLTSLQLNNTNSADTTIAQLVTLVNLQSLNLVGTKVTAAGVLKLASLKHLRHIYLYQANIKSSEFAMLQQKFPKTLIDSGGYKVPTLASDTTLVTKPPVLN